MQESNINPASSTADLKRVVVIADDMTGACDAAAAFLKLGHPVRVWAGPVALFPVPEAVQAINTDSRALKPNRAAHAVTQSVSALSSDRNTLIFKKIDSAGRGPLAAELLAAHKALKTRAVILAPAFPANGRTVQKGILNIRDASGQSTQVEITSLFPMRARAMIGLVSDPSQIEPVLESGKEILLCDSTEQSDLDSLAHSSEHLPGLLFAGSAGLAHALASAGCAVHPQKLPHKATQILVIAGSLHAVTQMQLTHLDRVRPQGSRILRILDFNTASQAILKVFHELSPKALIMTGGDTALIAVRALGAHSFILQGELAPGIPWGIVQGGEADGCVVVTKSGGFGSPTALNDIVNLLEGTA